MHLESNALLLHCFFTKAMEIYNRRGTKQNYFSKNILKISGYKLLLFSLITLLLLHFSPPLILTTFSDFIFNSVPFNP